jgi:putative zinc finger/helix-turn-helix YgiT family protein
MTNQCPFCLSENSLQEQTYQFSAHPMPGYSVNLCLKSEVCSYCDEQIESPSIAAQNSTTISDAKLKWLADNIEIENAIGYLVKELRTSLGVTQRRFSEIIGAKGVSISKYELHSLKPSALARTLFIVLAESKEARHALLSRNTLEFSLNQSISQYYHNPSHEIITFLGDDIRTVTPTTTGSSLVNSIVELIDKTFCNASKIFEASMIPLALGEEEKPRQSTKTRRSSQNLVSVY